MVMAHLTSSKTHIFLSPSSVCIFIEESDSPSDPNIQAVETKIMSSTPFQTQASPSSPSQPKQDSSPTEVKISPTFPPPSQDVEGNGAESGDSEIELVSDEPIPRAPTSDYMSFSKKPNITPLSTPPSVPCALATAPASASGHAMQYSILREEREAELDSELALESCGEDSPKRLSHDTAQPVKKPTTPPSTTAHHVTPTPSPTAPAPTCAPKEKTPTTEEKPKVSVTPVPSPGLPELKVEHPVGEVPRGERRRSSQGRRGSERQAAPPAIFQGLTREKGKCVYL